MKMAVVSELSVLLLLLLLLPSTESQGDCNTFAATGETIALPLGHQLKDTDRLKWRRGSDLFVDRKPVAENKYNFVKGDSSSVYPNGSLKLVNVKKSDAMKYTPLVFGKDGVSVPNLSSIQLCVLDLVKQPSLKIDCLKAHVNLTCKVAQVKDLNFAWLKNNKVMTNMNSQIWKLDRKHVKDGTDSFSCKVYNVISSRTSPPVIVSCNKSIFPGNLEGLIWISVGGGGGLVLMLTVITIVCCVRARRKKRNQKTDEEELRLRWTNPEQQQQQQTLQRQCPHRGHPISHHQHQHQQQPAGHTGPRQHRSKQPRPRPRDPTTAHAQPNPRRPAQSVRADVNGDKDQPPPLPQPRTKTPRGKLV